MAEKRKYATATAFRAGLEARLRQIAKAERIELQRLMRAIAFDRMLARLFAQTEAPWVLKGGYALELRMKDTRGTRDIDLALRETFGLARGATLNEAIFAALQTASALELEDFFSYVISPAMMELDGALYGGARFPVDARLDGRSFVKFHVDVASGDLLLGPLEMTEGRDWLSFAHIPAAKYPTISKEQHFAEKVHAYTLPRSRPNTRARDLVDMVLLLRSGLDKKRIVAATEATFKRRKTHSVPKKLDPPPAAWTGPFAKMAEQCGFSPDINAAFAEVESFFLSL